MHHGIDESINGRHAVVRHGAFWEFWVIRKVVGNHIWTNNDKLKILKNEAQKNIIF